MFGKQVRVRDCLVDETFYEAKEWVRIDFCANINCLIEKNNFFSSAQLSSSFSEAQLSSAQLSSAKISLARLGSTRLSFVSSAQLFLELSLTRLSSAQVFLKLSSVQLSSAQLDSDQLSFF